MIHCPIIVSPSNFGMSFPALEVVHFCACTFSTEIGSRDFLEGRWVSILIRNPLFIRTVWWLWNGRVQERSQTINVFLNAESNFPTFHSLSQCVWSRFAKYLAAELLPWIWIPTRYAALHLLLLALHFLVPLPLQLSSLPLCNVLRAILMGHELWRKRDGLCPFCKVLIFLGD